MTRDAEHTPSPQSVVVPVEPTEDMMLAGALVGPDTNNGQFGYDDARTVFVAMLAAAPAPSSLAGGEEESAGDMLQRLGMDGHLWAEEFRSTAIQLGYPDMDAGWLIGWFCNAVMAGYDHARSRYDPILKSRLAAITGDGTCSLSDAIDQFIGDAIANGSVEVDSDGVIGWCKPALEQTMVSSLAGCGYGLAALSPEAPAREGVPRDEHGRTAFEIIADCNRESMMRRAGVKDQSREPLLGPPSDMAVSRILLAERPEIDRHAADLLAIKINDTLAALTPRHEAPAEPVSDHYKFDDEIAWLREAARYFSVRDTKGEDRAHWANVYNAENARKLADRLAEMSSNPCQLEAPAEGAGEALGAAENLHAAAMIYEDQAMLEDAETVLSALRARSSAPEAREEALGNLLAVIHGDGGHRALEVGTKQAALEAEKIVARLLSSAPEAREREAWPERWSGPCTVGNMISNLRTLPPEMPLYSAYHIPMDDQPSLLKVKRPTLSRERVDGTNVKTGDESIPYSAVIWSQPRDPEEAHPAAPSADKLREAIPDLSSVIAWLANGCDPKHAVTELGIYKARIDHALSTPDALKGEAE